jgi:hypothetical protein
MVDGLTKCAIYMATSEKDWTAQWFTEIFIDVYFWLHGIPESIVRSTIPSAGQEIQCSKLTYNALLYSDPPEPSAIQKGRRANIQEDPSKCTDLTSVEDTIHESSYLAEIYIEDQEALKKEEVTRVEVEKKEGNVEERN